MPQKRLRKPIRTLAIRDVKHLCLLLGTSRSELHSICSGIDQSTRKYYHQQTVVRKGKTRRLATPHGRLRDILDRLNSHLQRLDFPSNMHGGLKGRTTRSYAKPHVRRPEILKSDIRDFFPSVKPKKVYDAFVKLGCSPDVAHFVTRLTTFEGSLPQGSPTSSVVANIVTMHLAQRLQGLAASFNGASGTFVDDIVLSGPAYVRRYKGTLLRIVSQEGLQAHSGKTVAIHADKEQVLAGIRVNHGLDTPREKVQQVRGLIDGLRADRQSGMTIDSKRVLRIKGKIRYIGSLNPGAAKSLSKRLTRTL